MVLLTDRPGGTVSKVLMANSISHQQQLLGMYSLSFKKKKSIFHQTCLVFSALSNFDNKFCSPQNVASGLAGSHYCLTIKFPLELQLGETIGGGEGELFG